MKALLLAAQVSAAVDPEKVKPGWVALVIVLLMGLATFLLWRSMNRQLKKVDFDDGSQTPSEGTAQPENGDQRA
jgi:hypothetical protein